MKASAITASPVERGRDNGPRGVRRVGRFVASDYPARLRPWIAGPAYRAWIRAVLRWVDERQLSHAIVNQPLNRFSETSLLYRELRRRGVVVGALQHDPPKSTAVAAHYLRLRDWERALRSHLAAERRLIRRYGQEVYYRVIGSQLAHAPDFLLAPSRWTAELCDPRGEAVKVVLHPLVPATPPLRPRPRPLVDIAMVNPIPKKGLRQLLDLVYQGDRSWRFSLLQGGWADAFRIARPLLDEAEQLWPGRVRFVDYVPRIEHFFAGARLLAFPSRHEGYGMTAVEALLAGTPVVATDYPAIVEGTGRGAMLVPFDASAEAWCAAVAEVLSEPTPWRARARERHTELMERSEQELAELGDFLAATRA